MPETHTDGPRVAAESVCTSPRAFRNPHSFRNRLGRLAWQWVYVLAYRWTPPRLAMGYRRLLLKAFGAKLGRCWIHPSAKIWAPWNLSIGDDTYIDRGCDLYNAFGLSIADRVIVSFRTTLCTATHDFESNSYPLIGRAIHIDSDVWVTAEVFITPGVHIREGAVVGARSVVTKNVSPWTLVAGNPARVIRQRILATEESRTKECHE